MKCENSEIPRNSEEIVLEEKTGLFRRSEQVKFDFLWFYQVFSKF